jgi:hypothetical protein
VIGGPTVKGTSNRVAVQVVRDQSYSVSVKPDWTEVERLRDFVGAWLFALMRDTHVRDNVVLVTAELLENAMRHGKPGQRLIEYEVRTQTGQPIVRVVNEIEPKGGAYDRLIDRLTWIARSGDPSAAFTKQIENIALGKAEGLGLTRIRYEGACDLSCQKLADGRVEVTATFRVG